MSEIKFKTRKMTLDEALACKRDEHQDAAYLEFYNCWINKRD